MPTSQLQMPTISDAETRSFSDALGAFVRVVQFRDRDRACCYDLSVSQFYALKAVAEGGPLTVNDLAARLYLDKSTASRVAQTLVAKGLLERGRDPVDGRVVRLLPTDAGSSVCAHIQSDLDAEYAELLSDFDPEVRAAASELIRRLGRAFARRVDVSNGRCCTVSVSSGGGR